MKMIFIRILLLAVVSMFGVSCATGPGHNQGQRRGGLPGGHFQGSHESFGEWYAVADGTYTHYRVFHNENTREIVTRNMGVVSNNDPGLMAWAKRVGHRIKNKGESTRVTIDEVPPEIREKILAKQRQRGTHGVGGVLPLPHRSGHPQGGYQPAPPCNSGYCPPQGGGYPQQSRQAPPAQYDSFGRIPQYVPTIPSGVKMWDAHQRRYW